MIIQLLLLSAGMILLIFGATILVLGASSIGKRLRISELVIGLTIVAFGTSTPELLVTLIASASGNTGIAMGNILGSNMANIFIILGIAALIRPVSIQNSTIRIEIPFSLMAIVLIWILANDTLIDHSSGSVLSRIDGIVLLSFFGIFLYYTFFSAPTKNLAEENLAINVHPIWKSAAFVVGGLAFLYAGGDLIVDSAVKIASELQVSEEIIGLTIIAIGTSLPELATSVVAALRGNSGIAIGNVVGSNIFNSFFILGITSVIRPIPYLTSYHWDIGMVILGSLLLLVFMLTGKRSQIDRWEGILFLLIYVAYIICRLGLGN